MGWRRRREREKRSRRMTTRGRKRGKGRNSRRKSSVSRLDVVVEMMKIIRESKRKEVGKMVSSEKGGLRSWI